MSIPTPKDLGIVVMDAPADRTPTEEEKAGAYLLQLIERVKAKADTWRASGSIRRHCTPVDSDPGVDVRILARLAAENGWQVKGSWFGPAGEDLSSLPRMREDK